MMTVLMPDVVLRRRKLPPLVIAAASTGLAAGYLWRFSSAARPMDLWVGILLGVIAVCHGIALTDSRRPYFVADATGVRIRLGSAWTGVPWDGVEHVEVEHRGRLRDGRVVVLAPASAALLAGAGKRSRWAAWLNRRLYGAALVAPYGLTTRVSVPDVAGSLERLADERAPVVTVGREEQPDTDAEGSAVIAVLGESDQPATDPAADAPLASPPPSPEPDRKPRRRIWAARDGKVGAGGPPLVAAVNTTARREERTIFRPAPPSYGTLALSEPLESPDPALPEIDQLRRSSDADRLAPVDTSTADAVEANVSLVIDATTDLSARAMQKVRSVRQAAVDGGPGVPAARVPADADLAGTGALIGDQLAHARTTLGLTVDELADRTRIRPSVIESIELDDFSPCGGDFYARGHLRMLARVLGIEADPLLRTYEEVFATSPVNARDIFEAELATGSAGMVRGGSSGANWGALIAAVLVLMVVWGVARYFSDSSGPTSPGRATTTTGARHGSSANAPSPLNVSPVPQAQVMVTVSGGASRVVVRDKSMRVLFSGVLADGESRHFRGAAPLRVHAADAGLVSLSVKGKDLGVLGPAGAPAFRVIGSSAARGNLTHSTPATPTKG
jgi:cytoskeleton protein RodZ